MILIATPEALASPRVADEWQSFIAANCDWLGRLLLAQLVDTPLPPFLEQVPRVDFSRPGGARYRAGLRKLLGGLLGHKNQRNLPRVSDSIEPEPLPRLSLDPALRHRLVDWLTPQLATPRDRKLVAIELGLDKHALEAQPSPACAASAALSTVTGADDPLEGAIRVAGILLDELDDEENDLTTLRTIAADLRAAHDDAGDSKESLLSVYLRQVADDHERLVPYLDQAEVTQLDRVYVPLSVSTGVARSQGSRQALEDFVAGRLSKDEPLTLEALLAADRKEHPWITGRFVVRGDPGAGKTTLLRSLARRLATDPDRPWLPVFASLPAWMREPMQLLDRLTRQLERSGHAAAGLDKLLDQLGRDGRLVLLLDGLDEVPRGSRADAERFLREQAQRWPQTPIVVTSRPIGYVNPAPGIFRDLDLLPLSRPQRVAFLARWFGRASGEPANVRAEAAVAQLDTESSLLDLARNPLYLTLIALLLEEGEDPQPRRARLYDQVFALLLAGKHRRGEVVAIDQQNTVHEVLRHLAHGMTVDNRDAEPLADIEDRLYRKELNAARSKLELVRGWRNGFIPFLKDVGEKTGILGPHDGTHADWRFWHRTFREALAAERLAAIYEKEGSQGVLDHAGAIVKEGDESRWAEPFALLAGRIDRPDELVKALVASHRDLGLRALATAQGLEPATFRSVLDLAEDDWQARAKVYSEIPGMVEDPHRAVALLEVLRRGTRNGNDLYFLHAALERLQKGKAAAEARAALARFFDHMQLAEADRSTFESVATKDQDTMPLWADLEHGPFTMGDNASGFEQEKPAHRVNITSAFAMARVPVTNAQFLLFDPDHPVERRPKVNHEHLTSHPVVNVTWYAAATFCRWLSVVLGRPGIRLASEEEWEYACRAGSRTDFCSGDGEKNLARVGWYSKNSDGRTHRVARKKPNAWDLYDMHGNVWEWSAAIWDAELYPKRTEGVEHDASAYQVPADRTGDADPTRGTPRVFRGGGYWDVAFGARSAYRCRFGPWDANHFLGFRVVVPSPCSDA